MHRIFTITVRCVKNHKTLNRNIYDYVCYCRLNVLKEPWTTIRTTTGTTSRQPKLFYAKVFPKKEYVLCTVQWNLRNSIEEWWREKNNSFEQATCMKIT